MTLKDNWLPQLKHPAQRRKFRWDQSDFQLMAVSIVEQVIKYDRRNIGIRAEVIFPRLLRCKIASMRGDHSHALNNQISVLRLIFSKLTL
ncbi:hypothetical protein ACN9MF_17995 [Methylobacterium fujisawaense]|uniref:hypothetical protein n=1 Tax=Methylobacterium fujisawaense TaxID=107400 RepID=UPI003CEAC8B7